MAKINFPNMDTVEVKRGTSIPLPDMKLKDFENQFRAKGNAKYERLANVNFELFNGMRNVTMEQDENGQPTDKVAEDKRGAEKGGTTIDYGICVYTTEAIDNALGWRPGSDNIDQSVAIPENGEYTSTPTGTPGMARMVTRGKDQYVRQIFDVDRIAQEQLADYNAKLEADHLEGKRLGVETRTYDGRINLTFAETSANNGIGAISVDNVKQNLGKLSAMKCMLSDGTDQVVNVSAAAYQKAAEFIADSYKTYMDSHTAKGEKKAKDAEYGADHKSLNALGLKAKDIDGAIYLVGGGMPTDEKGVASKTSTAYNNEVRALGEGFTSYLKDQRADFIGKIGNEKLAGDVEKVLFKIGVEMHPTQIDGHTVIQPQLTLSDRPFTNVVNNLYNYRNHRENLPVLTYNPKDPKPYEPYMTLREDDGSFKPVKYTPETERAIKEGTYKGQDYVKNMTKEAIGKLEAASDKAMGIYKAAGVDTSLTKLTKDQKEQNKSDRDVARKAIFKALDKGTTYPNMASIQTTIGGSATEKPKDAKQKQLKGERAKTTKNAEAKKAKEAGDGTPDITDDNN